MFQFSPVESNTLLLKNNSDRLVFFARQTVDAVNIEGKYYQLVSNSLELQPGQYKYKNGVTEVYLKDNVPQNVTLIYENKIDSLPVINLPDFITRVGDVEADIVTRTQFQGHLQTAIALNDCLDNVGRYESLLNGQEVTLFDLPLRIASVDIDRQPINNKVKVTISLQGKYAAYGADGAPLSPLDFPIRLIEFSSCNNFSTNVSISQLCSKVGLSYIGNTFNIKVPQNPGEMSVTVRSLITQRANYVGGYPFYSNSGGVEIRRWKERSHVLPAGGKLLKSPYQRSGQGHLWYGSQLSQVYRNTEIVLDNGDASIESEYYNRPVVTWKFENCASFGDLQSPAVPEGLGEEGYSGYRLPGREILKNPSNAYDSGGVTKSATEEISIRGTVVLTRTWTWGWVFSSLDTHRIFRQTNSERELITGTHFRRFVEGTARNVTRFWRQVSFTVTDYIFDQDGYLIREITTGRRLGRLLQDDTSLKAISALEQYYEYNLASDRASTVEERQEAERLAAAYYQLAKAYSFNRTFPETKTVYHQLKLHSQYYDDIIPPAIPDCYYVPPKFAAIRRTIKYQVLVAENPLSTPELPLPPIVTGHTITEETKIDILSTAGRGKIKTTTTYTDRRNDSLRQTIKYAPGSISSGRPNIQLRLSKPKPIDSQTNINKHKANRFKKFLINTSGVRQLITSSNNYPITEGSINLKDILDINKAVEIAELKSAIANSTGGESFTREQHFIPGIQEGDIVWDEGKAYLVKGVENTYSYHQQQFCRTQKLELGLLIEPRVNLRHIYLNTSRGTSTSRAIAIDGRISETNNIFNLLNPETARRAANLGLLEDLAEKTGNKVYGIDEFRNSENDLIDSFLKSTGESNSDESKLPIDLREKSDVEEFTDLINRLSLLDEFNSKLDSLVDATANQQQEDSSNGSGNGGGAGEGASSNIITDFEQPNIILEGGDEFLTDLLNGLMSSVQTLLDFLSGGSGSGGSGGGSGGGGSGGGGAGGGGQIPVFQTGDRIIYAPTLDINGILQAILDMLLEAIFLAENFSFDLPGLIAALTIAAGGGSGGAGGAGSAGSAGGAGSGVTTIVQQPEGVEPATIRTIFPDNLTLDDIDMTAIFQALDYLLGLLDKIANLTFDFDLDLSLIEPGAGLAISSKEQGASSNLSNSSGGSGSSSGGALTTGSTIYVTAEVEDITGIIGGGVTGATTFPSSWSPNQIRKDLPASTQQSEEGSGNSNDNTNSFGEGSDLPTGNPGEFTFDNGGLNNTVSAFSPIPVVISNATPTQFYYPYSAFTPKAIALQPELNVPQKITRILNGQAATVKVTGVTANDLVYWETVGDIPGVIILTPYDLNPSIRFTTDFVGDRVQLKVTMRSHDLSAVLTIETTTVDSLSLNNFKAVNSEILWLDLAVDINTIVPFNTAENEIIIGSQSLSVKWTPPNNNVIGYYVESANSRSPLLQTPNYQLQTSTKYRIIAVYSNYEIPSQVFELDDSLYLFASDSLNFNNFASSNKNIELNPVDNNFYTIESQSNQNDSLNLNNFATRVTNAVEVSYVEKVTFYTIQTTESRDDSLKLNNFASRIKDRVVVSYTEETVFSTG